MLRSSLGFHTLTLFLILTEKDARQLMKDFKKYSLDTGLIKIFPVEGNGLQLKSDSTLKKNKNFRVDYYQEEDRGIDWTIRYNNWSKEFKSYIIEVTINPKILAGIKDYVTAATYGDMETAITNFNQEAKRISPVLQHFGCYSLKSIHYCINFLLDDFDVTVSPESMMELVRKADIPPYYKEWMEYCIKSHRMKSDPTSFYLKNQSININIYNKYQEMKKRSEERVKKGLSPIPEELIEAAKNIIRFEVQCKYRKMYSLSNRAKEAGNTKTNKFENLLSDDACKSAINDYFNKVIGKGDWYTLQGAIRIIESYNFNKQRKRRLIDALQLVNKCRSVATAKASFQGDDLKAFKETLKDLSELGINPVTIPKDWGVKHISNLLYTYYDKVSEEKSNQEMKKFLSKGCKAFVKEFGWPSD